MPINIKNDHVSRQAAELTRLTGESITGAVGKAIEERLEQLRSQERRRGVADELMAIGRKCASLAPRAWLKKDFDAELYDKRGLPR